MGKRWNTKIRRRASVLDILDRQKPVLDILNRQEPVLDMNIAVLDIVALDTVLDTALAVLAVLHIVALDTALAVLDTVLDTALAVLDIVALDIAAVDIVVLAAAVREDTAVRGDIVNLYDTAAVDTAAVDTAALDIAAVHNVAVHSMPQMKKEVRMDQDERDLVVTRGTDGLGLAAGDLIVVQNCDQPTVVERGFGRPFAWLERERNRNFLLSLSFQPKISQYCLQALH